MDMKLQSILEEDKGRVMTELQRGRTVPDPQAVMEKELDRLSFLYAEQCSENLEKEDAARMLSVIKNMLPIMSSVDEVREWKQESAAQKDKGKISGHAMMLVAAGIVLSLASLVLIVLFWWPMDRSGNGMLFLSPVSMLAGCLCMFMAGRRSLMTDTKKNRKQHEDNRKLEFLADPDALWNSLHGAILLTDRYLEDSKKSRAYEAEVQAQASRAAVSPETVILLSGLLETAYGKVSEDPHDEASLGMISDIRYYLHRNQIETVDYSESGRAWFECLPGKQTKTLRPALVSGNALIKKGLASV